jgi:hypothetical protein
MDLKTKSNSHKISLLLEKKCVAYLQEDFLFIRTPQGHQKSIFNTSKMEKLTKIHMRSILFAGSTQKNKKNYRNSKSTNRNNKKNSKKSMFSTSKVKRSQKFV